MVQAIAIISDDPQRSGEIALAVPKPNDIRLVPLDANADKTGTGCDLVIVDVPLSDPALVGALRQKLGECSRVAKKLFIVDEAARRERVQANFLGATETISREKLPSCLAKHMGVASKGSDTKRSVDLTEKLNEGMFAAVQRGEALPVHDVEQCADLIAHNLRQDGIAAWLAEVKLHHSYTHRHSMHVTGLAVAFGLKHGMRNIDVHRLATGAMLHDIGKARIPIEILDKPSDLTKAERLAVREHATFSAEVLTLDGQFDAEVIDVAFHHHEYLDGSGYPEGLAGADINDLVRIVSIADVFSALVDKRAYKDAIPKEKSYGMLLQMEGKLDTALVRAFEEIALA